MICPVCQTENSPASQLCTGCGRTLTPENIPVPPLPPVVPPPPPLPNYTGSGYLNPDYQNLSYQAAPLPAPTADPFLEAMIPTKNMNAVTAYYLGLFSFIPGLGLFLGIAGFVLGVKGLKAAKQNPAVRGKTHAWVGVLAGGFFGFGQLILILCLIVYIIIKAITP